jgi:hypothetical protein
VRHNRPALSGSRPITPEHELARLLVATEACRTEQALRLAALAERVDPSAFGRVAVAHRLIALLARRVRDEGLAGTPAAAGVPLGEQGPALRALLLEATSSVVTRSLESARVAAVPLKGVTLASRLYGDGLLRDPADVDVLVATEHLRPAAEVIGELGYELVSGRVDRLPRLHLTFADPEGARPSVELHWRVHWYEETFARDLVRRSIIENGVRIPSAADEMAAALLFFHRDGFLGLRLAADVAGTWDLRRDELAPHAIAEVARCHPALAPALNAAAEVARATVGLPAAELMGSAAGLTRRTRLAVSLANWELHGDRDQMQADRALIDGLSTPPRGLGAFVVRAFLLEDGHTQTSTERDARERLHFALLRAGHPFKLIVRLVLALVRVRATTRFPHS